MTAVRRSEPGNDAAEASLAVVASRRCERVPWMLCLAGEMLEPPWLHGAGERR